MAYIPLITSIIAFIFAITVLDQFFARRKSFQLLWAIGLFMYSVAAFTEFYSLAFGITELVLRLWYLIGAIFVAAYMGMGTLYLLMRRRTANIIMLILGLASVWATIRVFTVDIDISELHQLTGIGVFPIDVRAILAASFNMFGTLALVGGAVYSAWIFVRKHILQHRVISNLLIAAGAMMPVIGGSIVALTDSLIYLLIFELLGIIIMFAGFLRTKEVFGFFRFPLIHGFKRVEEKPAG